MFSREDMPMSSGRAPSGGGGGFNYGALAASGLGAAGLGLGAMGLFGGGSGGGYDGPNPALTLYDSGAGRKFAPDTIAQIYRQALGRDANPNEIAQFQKFFENGDLEYQDIAEIVGGLPEANERRLRTQGKEYGDLLGASDNTILGRAQDSLSAHYRRLGRPDTSGFASSFAGAAQDLAMNRQNALAEFYGRGFGESRGAYAGLSDASRGRGQGLADSRVNFNRGLDMARLGQAYQNQATERDVATQQGMARGQMLGTLAGGALGAIGGPQGAYMGASIGGRLGQNYGLLRR